VLVEVEGETVGDGVAVALLLDIAVSALNMLSMRLLATGFRLTEVVVSLLVAVAEGT